MFTLPTSPLLNLTSKIKIEPPTPPMPTFKTDQTQTTQISSHQFNHLQIIFLCVLKAALTLLMHWIEILVQKN